MLRTDIDYRTPYLPQSRKPTRIVLTGGPGAGKTTLLGILKRQYSDIIGVAPEAASILFKGGFERPVSHEDRIHIQRSIYNLQNELEMHAYEQSRYPVIFCDRGSLDGAAYWEGTSKEFCFMLGTSLEREFDRYSAVIHLETSAAGNQGYFNTDVRIETPAEALDLDRRIRDSWSQHPNYIHINAECSFVEKLNRALQAVMPHLPQAEEAHPNFNYATAADLVAQQFL